MSSSLRTAKGREAQEGGEEAAVDLRKRVSWIQQNLIAALGGFWSLITLVLGTVVTIILAGVDAIATAVEKKQRASNTAAAEGGGDDDAAAAVNQKEEMQERRAARPEVEMVESPLHTGAAHEQ